MKHPVGILVFALLMSACTPGTTFPRFIPTPVPPDEDCSSGVHGLNTGDDHAGGRALRALFRAGRVRLNAPFSPISWSNDWGQP